MSNLTITQKKVILIGAGVLLLLICFFLVFQKNTDETSRLETETSKLEKQVQRLSMLQMKVNDMQLDAEEHKNATETYTKEFPCKVPQQNAIFNVYKMMVDTEARVTSIRPSDAQKFLEKGEFVVMDRKQAAKIANGEVEEADVEKDPESQVEIADMVGKFSKYEVDITGTEKQLMKAVDWIRDNEEHMSVTALSFGFDQSTGKLVGTATINYYEMNGNGSPYKEPNVKGIKIGTDSVFGILKK